MYATACKANEKNLRVNNGLTAGSVWLAENTLVVSLKFVPLIYQLQSAFVELLVLFVKN